MRHYKYVEKEYMADGDMVAGVCYAAAAEDLIRRAFAENEYEWDRFQPAVIGYMVKAEDDKDELHIEELQVMEDMIGGLEDELERKRGDCGDECECWGPEEVDE